jgi:hypothetical protein
VYGEDLLDANLKHRSILFLNNENSIGENGVSEIARVLLRNHIVDCYGDFKKASQKLYQCQE